MNKKNPPQKPQKQDPRPVEEPMRKPEEGGEDIERDRSSNRNKGEMDSGVISNDEEVELEVSELEDDESEPVTGRHPSMK